jgi:hypothetical protein
MHSLAESIDTTAASDDRLWSAVDELIEAAPSFAELRWHRLHLLATDRRRAKGLEITPEMRQLERQAALRSTAALMVLDRVRASYDGRLARIKGYEVAMRFPNPVTRPFVDVDLLADDAVRAHQALRSAGFVEIGDPDLYLEIHHLRPLSLPELTLPVELHLRPKWPVGLKPPPTDELLDSAVPSATGIDGLSALAPHDHALVLTAHSWAHLPLRRILELIDIALIAREASPGEIEARAGELGFERVWRTTKGSIDSLFYGARPSSAQRLWARHLASTRERTVFESHVERWLSPFWSLPLGRATSAMASTAQAELGPAEGETWREKLVRVWKALRNASSSRSEHERQLGDEAHRRRRNR